MTHHALDQTGQLTVHSSTVSTALASMPPTQHLSALHSGSWINSDYKIWIGHQEDNRGWDLLGHTRTQLLDRVASLPPDRAQAAWRELYAAEGSDWFWWYGDDFDTDFKPEFDRLFRTHLRNVWTHMGLPPPDQLNQAICAKGMPFDSEMVQQPVGLLTPTIDGRVTNFFEWRGAGTISTQPPLGAMWKADGIFTAIRFGWNLDQFVMRFDVDETNLKKEGFDVEIVFQGLQSKYRLTFPLSLSGPGEFQLSRRTTTDVWQTVGSRQSIHAQTVLELAIPWKDLDLETGQTIQLSVAVQEHGLEVARYPSQRPAVLTVPGPDFEAGMWRV